ncbi:MAG TPA: class I SAM-dependent methyltransferase [Polyangiaceae bacterium]
MPRDEAANFDLLARIYAPLERFSFGRALERRRACFLADSRVANARRVLALGDGDGRFTATLLERYPALEVSAVDASAAMLGELQRRVRQRCSHAALSVHHADVRTWSPPQRGFDLVAAHFFFDCFTKNDIHAMVLRIAPTLTPDARWLVSDFAIPSGGARALAARLLVRVLYFAQWAATGLHVKHLADYRSALTSAGFACMRVENALGGLLRSELWQRRDACPAERVRDELRVQS